jgi:energy-coupling factor transporter ATP-binding protein EcfA2
LDEPTSNLNQISRQRSLELLSPFKKAGMSLIVASSDTYRFSELADRSMRLYEGLIEAEPTQVRTLAPAQDNPSLRSRA